MRVAIIGSGIAGLVVARELHRTHAIAVLEQDDYLGGHAHTIVVEDNGRPLALDTGFIVFNEQNYPRFSVLLKELGVCIAIELDVAWRAMPRLRHRIQQPWTPRLVCTTGPSHQSRHL